MNGTGRAPDETDRITAVHAGGSNHQLGVAVSLSNEPGIAVVCDGAGLDAIITVSATVQVDDHRLIAIDGSVIEKKVEHPSSNFPYNAATAEVVEEVLLLYVGMNVLLERGC